MAVSPPEFVWRNPNSSPFEAMLVPNQIDFAAWPGVAFASYSIEPDILARFAQGWPQKWLCCPKQPL